MLSKIGDIFAYIWVGIISIIFVVMMIAFPIGFICLIGWGIYQYWQEPKLLVDTGKVMGSFYGIILLAAGAVMLVGAVIGFIGKRYSEKERVSFQIMVKWITGIAQIVYVPWTGWSRYDEGESTFLGYSFILSPLSKNNFDTGIDMERALLTFVAWCFAMYGLRVALIGQDKAKRMMEGTLKFEDLDAPEEEAQPSLAHQDYP